MAPSASLLSFTHTMRKWAGRQTRRRGKNEKSCLLLDCDWSPLCRKWFTALLSQFTPAGPDLRQVQIYTSSSRFTPESWPLPPIAPGCPLPGGIYTFTTETALTIVKCFRLRSGAATFSQALCKALGNRLVGRVWLRCRKWVQHTNTAPSPPFSRL